MPTPNATDVERRYAELVSRYGPHSWAWPEEIVALVYDDDELRELVHLGRACPDC